MVRHKMPGQILQRHQQPVGDGLGRIISDDVARFEAAVGVIGLLGLGGDDPGFRRQRRQG